MIFLDFDEIHAVLAIDYSGEDNTCHTGLILSIFLSYHNIVPSYYND